MPYIWVEPSVFMTKEETGGEPVYHVHRHGLYADYHYQVPSDEYDTGYAEFDIRDLADALDTFVNSNDRKHHKAIIQHGIAAHGMLPAELLDQLEVDTCEGETWL